MTTVAVLGTGKMGGAMARRLAASGLQVVLWNRTRDKAEQLHLGRVAATPAEATRDAEVVISSLTNDAAVRDVYLGDNGVLRSAADKLLIDASTAGPLVSEELGRDAQANGARLLEAPVIGSVPAVESGKLADPGQRRSRGPGAGATCPRAPRRGPLCWEARQRAAAEAHRQQHAGGDERCRR
jgi:3-hydroxyisobutyrate dehydrogenase-like beta-hydroxyacid dehydrogenase